MPKLDELVVRASGKNTVQVMLIGVVFGGLGVFFFLMDSANTDRYIDLPVVLVRSVGLVAMVFFGLLTTFAAFMHFDRSPVLVINKDGVLDWTGRRWRLGFRGQQIPWKDIEDIRTRESYGLTVLSIYLRTHSEAGPAKGAGVGSGMAAGGPWLASSRRAIGRATCLLNQHCGPTLNLSGRRGRRMADPALS